MALTPIAINTSLGRFIAMMRMKSGTLEDQELEIFNLQAVDVAHYAICETANSVPKKKYQTSSIVTETSNLIDLSTLDIADKDLVQMSLYDSTVGNIPLLEVQEFDKLRSRYTTAELVSTFFAKIDTTSDKLQIKTYRGANVVSPGTLTFTYIRNPFYQTSMTGMVDLPEELVPTAIEVATKHILEIVKNRKGA